MLDHQRQYVDLIFRTSRKYASWDPELTVEVGDWGRTVPKKTGVAFWQKTRSIFLKEGNIYSDGKAEAWDIPAPKELDADAEGPTWITSDNAQEVELSADILGQSAISHCKIKAAFKVSSGRGAILVMNDPVISAIDPPSRLRRLLDDDTMRGFVTVSQVHRCSSYARLLSAKMKHSSAIAIGLSDEAPTNAKWILGNGTGDFKSQVNKNGKRDYYPLFKLVSLGEGEMSPGLKLSEGEDPPLPDAEPPWMVEGPESPAEDGKEGPKPSKTRRFKIPLLC